MSLIFKEGLINNSDERGQEVSASLSNSYAVIKVKSPIPNDTQYDGISTPAFPVIPFFDGFNNFAELLGLALEISPVHAACVQSKARYSVGDGFDIKPGNKSLLITVLRALKKAAGISDGDRLKIEAFISECNNEGDDLFDLAYQSFFDFYGYGNSYIQLIRGSVSGKKYFNIWQHQANTVLLEKPNPVTGASEAVYVSQHWKSGLLYGNYKPERVGLWPNWTKTEDGLAETTMIRVREYSARRVHYGLPQSVASLLWKTLEYKIPKYNSDSFDNGFNPSALVQFFGAMDEGEKKKFLNEFHKTFTGDGTGSRLFAQIVPDKAMEAKVTMFDKKNEGNYLELDKVTSLKIITAHTWHPKLAGIMFEGQLGGDSRDILNAWELAENTVIKFARKKIGKMYNIALTEGLNWLYGTNTQKHYLDFLSSMPISFLGDVDVNAILTINEAREQAGYSSLKDKDGKELERGFDRVHLDTRPVAGNIVAKRKNF